MQGSVVYFNATALATTWVSTTRLTATLPATLDTATQVSPAASVTVQTPDGPPTSTFTTSSAQALSIYPHGYNPSPILTHLTSSAIWQYGWWPSLSSPAFTRDTSYQPNRYSNNLEGWYVSPSSGGNPSLLYNATASIIQTGPGNVETWQPAELGLAPGPAGQDCVLRFVAPATGLYSVQALFTPINPNATTDVHVLQGSAQAGTFATLYDGTINSASPSAATFQTNLALTAGDTLDFACGYGANGSNTGNRTGIATLITTEPVPVSISFSPSIVTGGNSSTATITLSRAAPTGGTAVLLTSSNTDVATLPASVTVPGGATQATFIVSTQPVQTPTPVVITANEDGLTQQATLNVVVSQPPVTTASLSGTAGSNSFYTSAVQVTLSATDPDGAADIAGTFYTVDGGAQQTYSAPFTVATDGAHTVTYYSTDNEGNSETPHSVSFSIDATPPATTETDIGNAQGRRVTLAASDALSGVAATFYTLDGGTLQGYTAPFEVINFGYHTVTFYSTDKAGNTEATHSVPVNINYPVPSTTGLSPSTASAGGAGFTLTVSGHLFNTGSVVYWNGTALPTTFVGYQQVTAPVPASLIASAGSVSVTVSNPAPGGGSSNAQTFTITGNQPPVTTASLSGTAGSNSFYTSAVQVTLSATDPDGAADIAGTFYTVDGGAQQTYSAPFTVATDGAHTITYYSTDKAGNSETPHTAMFSVDATPPTTQASQVSNPQGIKVTLTAADTGPSGLAATLYSVDGAAYQTYSAPFEVVNFGYHTVAFYSTDKAGNAEAVQTVQANINYPLPNTTSLNPASVQAGGAGFTLKVNGHFFNSGSVVYWNGAPLAKPTVVSYQQLSVTVPASLITTAHIGTAQVTVVNPAPGGGTSNAQTFTVMGTVVTVVVGTLSRASGVITAHLNVQNAGNVAAPNLKITIAQLGATGTSTALPLSLGTLAAGASVNVNLTFPGSAGTSGSTKTLTVNGAYTGGTFNTAHSVTLP